MTCDMGVVQEGGSRGRTGGCVAPLLCLGGADSPAVIRRKVFAPHKTKEDPQPVQLSSIRRQPSEAVRGRSKGAALRRASTRLGNSVKKAALRRSRSERMIARPEIVLVPEPVYAEITYGTSRPPCDENSEPLYDVPVPRLAKVTQLRRSSSAVYPSAFSPVKPSRKDVSDCNPAYRRSTLSAFNRAHSRAKPSHVSNSCVATKDLWYNKLQQVMTEERDKDPPSTTIQVTYYDPINNIDFVSIQAVQLTFPYRSPFYDKVASLIVLDDLGKVPFQHVFPYLENYR